MRKIFTLCCLAAATCANAQTLTEIKEAEEAGGVMVQTISNNGKYVGGMTFAQQLFLHDLQSGKSVILEPEDDFGAEVRGISNDGIGIGYNGPAITVDMSGNAKIIEQSTEEYYCLGESITDDGKIMTGSVVNLAMSDLDDWQYKACYWENGKLAMLPSPTSEEMTFPVAGSSAKRISADGSVILGHLVDNMSSFPAIIWKRVGNEYQLDTICKGQFAPSIYNEELGDYEPREEPYPLFQFAALSANGKYVALNVARYESYYDEDMDQTFTFPGETRIAIYNTETKEIQEIVIDGSTGIEEGTSCAANAIANDGTVIGYTGDGFMQPRQAIILKAGEKQPKLMAEEFSSIEQIATFDELGMNSPCAITGDGRYIAGFAMIPYEMEIEGEVFETSICEAYVIDREGDPTAISSTVKTAKKATEYFTVDGRKVAAPVKGLNIIKSADGTTKKVFVK